MTREVVAAFFLGALSYHLVQSVVFTPFEIPNGPQLASETVAAHRKNFSPDPYRADMSEGGTKMIGDEPNMLMAGVRASNKKERQDRASYEIVIANHTETSRAFDSLGALATSHIGPVLTLDSAYPANTIFTHLAPIELTVEAHVGYGVRNIDETPEQEHRIAHIGEQVPQP